MGRSFFRTELSRALPALSLVALACGPGLGLPLRADPADLPLAEIQRYATPEADPGGSPLPFHDIRPSDWAYQALFQLIGRYGCVAGHPDGTYRGPRAITRHEAAALLAACLERITENTDERRALVKEFARELALLRGRVDGLEARVGELNALRFSPITKLSGQATFVLGGNAFLGSAAQQVGTSQAEYGATTLSYDLQLTFDSSFNGSDLLRANLRGGNFASSSFGGAGPSTLSQLEIAFQEYLGELPITGRDVVAIDRLYYQVPWGNVLLSVGGRISQDNMLAIWPSVYPADTVLDVLTLGGAPAAYNKTLGAGAGLWWQSQGFAISASYVAAYGDNGMPSEGGAGHRRRRRHRHPSDRLQS